MQLVNELNSPIIKVFVSYTMRDSYITKHLLTCVERGINSHSQSYIDVLHNDSVLKQLRVENELISSDLMVLIGSESVHESTWVQRELQLAEKHAIPMIRVNVNESMSAESIMDKLSLEIWSYKKELTISSSGQSKASFFCVCRKLHFTQKNRHFSLPLSMALCIKPSHTRKSNEKNYIINSP